MARVGPVLVQMWERGPVQMWRGWAWQVRPLDVLVQSLALMKSKWKDGAVQYM